MPIHSDLICPRCGGRDGNLIESSFGDKYHCTKCHTKGNLSDLRCRLEKAHKPDLLNTRKGYNPFVASTIAEQGRQINSMHEHEARMHKAKAFLDICDPNVRDRKFDNYTVLKAI